MARKILRMSARSKTRERRAAPEWNFACRIFHFAQSRTESNSGDWECQRDANALRSTKNAHANVQIILARRIAAKYWERRTQAGFAGARDPAVPFLPFRIPPGLAS